MVSSGRFGPGLLHPRGAKRFLHRGPAHEIDQHVGSRVALIVIILVAIGI